jgi:hypothetical protein
MPRLHWNLFSSIKNNSIKRKRVMARRIKFVSPTGDKLFTVTNHIADVVKHYTIIYDQNLFSRFRIFDIVDNLEIDKDRIRVNYETGAYLLIQP